MKFKVLKFLAVTSAILMLTSCGNVTESSNTGSENKAQVTEENTTTIKETTTAKVTTAKVTTAKTTTKVTTAPEVALIGRRTTDYDQSTDTHRVFFAFYDSSQNAMTPDAEIKIVITNDNGEEVYNQTKKVTKSDYSEWTNSYWDGKQTMGCIYISNSEITGGSISKGTLTIGAKVSNSTFDDETISINHLPAADFILNTPEFPLNINNYGYKEALYRTIQVKSMEYKFTNEYSDKLTLKFTVSMLYNDKGDLHSDSSSIGYKIKNSEGIIVESGTFYIEAMAVGETVIEEETVYDIPAGDTYTIELIDTD